MRQKNGRIRHLDFSVHGSLDVMKRFLSAYGEHMEFGQIQLNYIDWSFQDAKTKLALLEEYSIPIWVMEPMRGGKRLYRTHDPNVLAPVLPVAAVKRYARSK